MKFEDKSTIAQSLIRFLHRPQITELPPLPSSTSKQTKPNMGISPSAHITLAIIMFLVSRATATLCIRSINAEFGNRDFRYVGEDYSHLNHELDCRSHHDSQWRMEAEILGEVAKKCRDIKFVVDSPCISKNETHGELETKYISERGLDVNEHRCLITFHQGHEYQCLIDTVNNLLNPYNYTHST